MDTALAPKCTESSKCSTYLQYTVESSEDLDRRFCRLQYDGGVVYSCRRQYSVDFNPHLYTFSSNVNAGARLAKFKRCHVLAHAHYHEPLNLSAVAVALDVGKVIALLHHYSHELMRRCGIQTNGSEVQGASGALN